MNAVRPQFGAERPMLVVMEQKGLRNGHFLALAGALLAVVSLFRPWYTVEIPQEVRDLFSAQGMGSDPGLFGEMVRGLASQMPSSISASGWKELEGADIAIAVAGAGVVALVLAAAGAINGLRADPGPAGGLVGALGGVIVVIALAHLVNKPGAQQAADWVHVSDGLWIALAGGALTAFGGLWAASEAGASTSARARPSAPYRDSAPSSSASLNADFPPLTPELPPVFAESSASVAPPA
ncbi:hypothetical protein [Baekduia sp. Peel2402]|uniref:hypothetical protein n=1 Tax=Baekduia sp. Peel2402 TaxID=3458296 RepID=UPI00403E7AE2